MGMAGTAAAFSALPRESRRLHTEFPAATLCVSREYTERSVQRGTFAPANLLARLRLTRQFGWAVAKRMPL